MADGGTSFIVRAHVGKLVVPAECLARACSPHPAGNIKLLASYIVPNLVDCTQVGSVAGQRGYVRHAGVQIRRPNRVPYRFRLVDHLLMGLIVFSAAASSAARST